MRSDERGIAVCRLDGDADPARIRHPDERVLEASSRRVLLVQAAGEPGQPQAAAAEPARVGQRIATREVGVLDRDVVGPQCDL